MRVFSFYCTVLFSVVLSSVKVLGQKVPNEVRRYANEYLWEEEYLPHSIYSSIDSTKGNYFVNYLGAKSDRDSIVNVYSFGATFSHAKRLILVEEKGRKRGGSRFTIIGKTTDSKELKDLFALFTRHAFACEVRIACYEILLADSME